MQLTPTARPTEVRVTPGGALQPMPAPGATEGSQLNDPAPRFIRVHANDIFAMQGATMINYSSKDTSTVTLRFMTEDFARMARATLRDTVLGAKLLYADMDGAPYAFEGDGPMWTHHPSNMTRNIVAMPGVLKFDYLGDKPFVYTDTQETRVRIQQLVRPKLDDRWEIWFKGMCFGKACPMPPAPPTGEVPWPPTGSKPKPAPALAAA